MLGIVGSQVALMRVLLFDMMWFGPKCCRIMSGPMLQLCPKSYLHNEHTPEPRDTDGEIRANSHNSSVVVASSLKLVVYTPSG